MKRLTFIPLAMTALLAFTSCKTLVYTTASNIQPVTRMPPSLTGKGDVEVSGGYFTYNGHDKYFDLPYEDFDVAYSHLKNFGGFATIDGAVKDHLALGLAYRVDRRFASVSHGLTASATVFRNYKLERKTNQVGFDVISAFSMNAGKNFMSADTVLLDLVAYSDWYPWIILDYDISRSGHFMIGKMDLKTFVQPSFTFENRLFEMHIGGSIGYHYRHRFEPGFPFDHHPDDQLAYHNPLVYYGSHKHFFFGEYFIAFGLGNAHIRGVWTIGGGRRTDAVQSAYTFGSVGIRGRF